MTQGLHPTCSDILRQSPWQQPTQTRKPHSPDTLLFTKRRDTIILLTLGKGRSVEGFLGPGLSTSHLFQFRTTQSNTAHTHRGLAELPAQVHQDLSTRQKQPVRLRAVRPQWQWLSQLPVEGVCDARQGPEPTAVPASCVADS